MAMARLASTTASVKKVKKDSRGRREVRIESLRVKVRASIRASSVRSIRRTWFQIFT